MSRRKSASALQTRHLIFLLFAGTFAVFMSLQLFPAQLPASGRTADAESARKKQVLVLNSYHRGLSWTDNIVKGIESVLLGEGRAIELHFEYMDTKRYLGNAYFQKLFDLYNYKYRKEKFDLVIVGDNDALNFVLSYRKKLFPGVPLVFCGINYFKDSMVKGQDLISGVVEETDVGSTLDVALRLHPGVRQVYVIDDRTTTGIAMKEEVLDVLPHFSGKAEFIFLDDLDIEELKERLRTMPLDSVILLLVMNQDRSGRFFTYEESLELLYPESKVPIYSVWDFYAGRGIVGGMLTSGYEQGKSAALIALRVLNGRAIQDIPIVRRSPNLYMFDHRELKRFGIKESALPPGSVLVNMPDTFYTKYKKFIITSAVTISALALIIVILLINMSMRKRMERALRDSEEKYRDLYDNAPDMYHSINRDGIVVDCNETEASMLGYRKEEIIGRPIADFLTGDSRKIYEQEFSALKDHRALFGLEREFVRKDGTILPASLNVFIERDEKGELIRTKTIGRDVTERKRVEEALRRSREDLRSLSAHIQSAREEERGHIAREIHDELGQILSKLKLDLSWLKKRLTKGQETLVDKTEQMSDLVDTTIKAVQRISSELRPGVLDYLGLAAAIEWQSKEFKERTGIECAVAISAGIGTPDQNISTAVFRIFQETLTNIIRHANATRVEVSLKKEDNVLILVVKDNGIGISEEKVSNHASFGLMGMRERARFLGGKVTVNGVTGEGTTVSVLIPPGPAAAS